MGGTLNSSKVSKCDRCGAYWPATTITVGRFSVTSKSRCTACGYIKIKSMPLQKGA